MSIRPNSNNDFDVFASMMEARHDRHVRDGRCLGDSKAEMISRIFELIHDAKDALNSSTILSIIATDIALHAMELAKVDGKFAAPSAKKDSIRIIDAHKHAVRDSSHRHVVVHHDKTMLWGAKLEADFEVTDDSLKPCLPAIRQAFETLSALNVKIGLIQIMNGFVKVFPEEGVPDPRHEDISIPVDSEF